MRKPRTTFHDSQTLPSIPQGELSISFKITYDSLNRLSSVNYDKIYNSSYKGDKIQKYLYDTTGNRTALENYRLKTNNQERELNKDVYTNNTLNEYTGVNTQNKNGVTLKTKTYTYDNNGNLKTDDTSSYTYDYKNRLVKVITLSTNTTKVAYTYDILGRRNTKQSWNVSIKYIYSNQDAVVEERYQWSSTLTLKERRENVYWPRGLDDIIETLITPYSKVNKLIIPWVSMKYYYQKDQLWSVKKISDQSGTVVEEYEYDVFGSVFVKKTTQIEDEDEMTINNIKYVKYNGVWVINNTRLYTGREYEKETSLYYMRARYYSGVTGRFISRDPIGIADDVNLYSYTKNNPVNWVDRRGLWKTLIIGFNWWNWPHSDIEVPSAEIKNRAIWQILSYFQSDKVDIKDYNATTDIWEHGGLVDAYDYILKNSSKYSKIIIIWHSQWADNAVQLSNKLDESKIKVNLLITIDLQAIVYDSTIVKSNTKIAVNYYQNNFFTSIDWDVLSAEQPEKTNLTNFEVNSLCDLKKCTNYEKFIIENYWYFGHTQIDYWVIPMIISEIKNVIK